MLNVLPAIAPLLSRQMTSVMFTDNILQAAEETTEALSALLCSDVTTISLILDLAPNGHLGYTTEAAGTEAITQATVPGIAGRQRQYHMRISWKIPDFGDGLGLQDANTVAAITFFNPEQLPHLFFKIYLKMFSYEDLSSLMGNLMRQFKTLLSGDLRYYNRMILAILLNLAKNRIQTHWTEIIDRLIDLIEADRTLLVGTNPLQEFHALLNLFGLFSNEFLTYHLARLPCICFPSKLDHQPQTPIS